MSGYLLYAFLILAGFGLWFALFVFMRKRSDRKRDLTGYVLLGPLHGYFKKRNYLLSMRELFGWVAVLVLMLTAPFLTRLLGN